MPKQSWFFETRQDWIAEILRIIGFINRGHLEKKFGISTAQASHDLQVFQKRNPGSCVYNNQSKRYEATA